MYGYFYTGYFTGCIPLRHLVYRVLDLPSSMQSLVYDFGQLSSETEQQYTKKIVERYVCCSYKLMYMILCKIITENKD